MLFFRRPCAVGMLCSLSEDALQDTLSTVQDAFTQTHSSAQDALTVRSDPQPGPRRLYSVILDHPATPPLPFQEALQDPGPATGHLMTLTLVLSLSLSLASRLSMPTGGARYPFVLLTLCGSSWPPAPSRSGSAT